jgi:DNA modification methylase
MQLEQRSIVFQPIGRLVPNSRNARTHPKYQVRQIAESLREFGFTNPILIDRANRIIAGHGRLEAAKLLGLTSIPTICLEGLTDEQIRAYVIADNRLAELAGWDRSILAIEFEHLLTLDCPDLNLTVTGFAVPEIDQVIEESRNPSEIEDQLPEPDLARIAVTEPDDLWRLGKHRLFCGNSLLLETYRSLMGSNKAEMVFTDSPYNVKINGHATGNGGIRHREFAMASGEMSEAEFTAFLDTTLRLLAKFSKPKSVHYLFIDWRHIADLIAAGKRHYDELINICVWVKNSCGLGSFYRSQHELIGVFRRGQGPSRNNVQLGKFGRNRANVWNYPGIQTFSRQSDEGKLLALHPTIKPIALVADAILDCTARGEIVLDAFLGSGTTLMAAERVGRVCYGIEIDPLYVDVAVRRWQKLTGEKATHALSGEKFDEVAAQKEAENA